MLYAVMCAIHAKRVTIMPKDIQLARRISGESLISLFCCCTRVSHHANGSFQSHHNVSKDQDITVIVMSIMVEF